MTGSDTMHIHRFVMMSRASALHNVRLIVLLIINWQMVKYGYIVTTVMLTSFVECEGNRFMNTIYTIYFSLEKKYVYNHFQSLLLI